MLRLICLLIFIFQIPAFASKVTRVEGCAMMLAGPGPRMLDHFERRTVGEFNPRIDGIVESSIRSTLSIPFRGLVREVVAVRITRSITLSETSKFYEVSVALRTSEKELPYIERLHVRMTGEDADVTFAPSVPAEFGERTVFHRINDLAQNAVGSELPNGLAPEGYSVHFITVPFSLPLSLDGGIVIVELSAISSTGSPASFEVPVEIRNGRVKSLGTATLKREPEFTPITRHN